MKAILTLHVDDGSLFGTRSDPIYRREKGLICIQFDVKRWEDLNNPDGVDDLGLRCKFTREGMQADVQKHVDRSKRHFSRKQLFAGCWHRPLASEPLITTGCEQDSTETKG